MKIAKYTLNTALAAALFTLSTTFNSSYSSKSSDKINGINIETPKNSPIEYMLSDFYRLSPFMTPELLETSAQKIAQAEFLEKYAKGDSSLVPLVNSPEGLDSYLERIASYKKTKEEESFDKTLKNVLSKKNIHSALVDFYLIKGSAYQESKFNPNAVSNLHYNDSIKTTADFAKFYPLQARGYMQLMEVTFKHFKPKENYLENVFKPEKNLEVGIDYYLYLEKFIKQKHPNIEQVSDNELVNKMIASYNGGHGHLQKKNWKIENMKSESINHVKYVNKYIQMFKENDKIGPYAKEYVKRKNELIRDASTFHNF
jgi:hypothetical protein